MPDLVYKRIFTSLIFVATLFLFSFGVVPESFAASCDPAIVAGTPEVPQNLFTGQDFEIKLKMDPTIAEAGNLVLLLTTAEAINPWDIASEPTRFDPKGMIANGENTLVFKFKGSNVIHPYDGYIMRLKYTNAIRYSEVCDNLGKVKINEKSFGEVGSQCRISLPDNIQANSNDYKLQLAMPNVPGVIYGVLIGPPDKITPMGKTTYYKVTTLLGLRAALTVEGTYYNGVNAPGGTLDFKSWGNNKLGNYRVALNAWVQKGGAGGYYHGFTCAHKDFKISNAPTTAATEGKTIAPVTTINATQSAKVEVCQPGMPGCTSATGEIRTDSKGNQCVGTAIGCVPTNLNSFINALLVWTAGIAGGIAFLLMIYGSFQMITSQGNADQLKKGREQFIAAISGLLFIIFSITLLQIIGADILGIPGFTR